MQFSKLEHPIDERDLENVERRVGRKLPQTFKSHYLKFNGGTPHRAWFPGNSMWEPIEIKIFFPIKYNRNNNDLDRMLLDGKYVFMRAKNVIPENLLPFASDHGGNFICLDLKDASIKYFTTDSFDSEASLEVNHRLQQREIASSFIEFLDRLTAEDNS